MNLFLKLFIIISIIFTIGCNGNKSLYYKNINEESSCSEKGGYWYKGKCWSDFEEEGYLTTEIDKEVERQMAIIEKAQVTVNGETNPLTFFFPEIDGKEVLLITVFGTTENAKTLLQTIEKKQLKNKNFNAEAILYNGNIMRISDDKNAMDETLSNPIANGQMNITANDIDALDFKMSGLLKNEKDNKSYQIDYKTHEIISGAGNSTVEVMNNEIHINGELGTLTYHQLKEAIDNHPNAKTVVLGNIAGSLNDEVNMHTGRILREANLNTKVLKDSEIASGGVDLFCAGKVRIVEKGAKIGIHSWCCLNDLTAAELPKDHPAHQYQLDYFTMCMGKKIGPDFYFHTLTSAPFDSVHWMSDEEIKKWKVATVWKEQ